MWGTPSYETNLYNWNYLLNVTCEPVLILCITTNINNDILCINTDINNDILCINTDKNNYILCMNTDMDNDILI